MLINFVFFLLDRSIRFREAQIRSSNDYWLCSIPLITVKNFGNWEDMISAIRMIGLMQRYVMVIKGSCRDKKVVIACDRGGSYWAETAIVNKKRKSASRLINFPFKILGKMTADWRVVEVWDKDLVSWPWVFHWHGWTSILSSIYRRESLKS